MTLRSRVYDRGVILYKYLPLERIDILRTGQIMFTRPLAFKDLFDGVPSFEYLWEPGFHPNQTGFHVEIIRGLHQWWYRDADQNAITRSVVVLPLSERRDSILMWAHYARAHTGFAIGFDSEHDWFRRDAERGLVQVSYTNVRPHRRVLSEFTPEQMIATKSEQWSYEQEWRLIDSTAAACGPPPSSSPHSFPFILKPLAVKEVVIGRRTPRSTHAHLRRLIAHAPFTHVQLFEADVHPRHFELEFHKIKVLRRRPR